MGPASSRIHFPEEELSTPEHEITDQEHTPLFPTHNPSDANVNGRRAWPLVMSSRSIGAAEIQKCTSVAVVTSLLGCRFWRRRRVV